ncbi:hypothetical protein HMPREF9374_0366 [Desmospora sp. 8437]|nr:hypothetical protein HMPREF9374_0366 [Desmospora sp. 8437]
MQAHLSSPLSSVKPGCFPFLRFQKRFLPYDKNRKKSGKTDKTDSARPGTGGIGFKFRDRRQVFHRE